MFIFLWTLTFSNFLKCIIFGLYLWIVRTDLCQLLVRHLSTLMFAKQKIRLISVITAKPLGERTLPDEYICLQKKPDNLTWDEFTVLARKQFKIDQENELKRLRDKKQ